MSLTTGDLVYSFAALTPAGTPIDAPLTQPLIFPSLEVIQVTFFVPTGNQGNLGWQLGDQAGDIIVPTNGGYIVCDNLTQTWALYDSIQTGAWTMTSYNTGNFDHTVYLWFLCQPLVSSAPAGVNLTVVPTWPSISSAIPA